MKKDFDLKGISKHDAQKLVAVCLLTDGSLKWNKAKQSFIITFHNKDECLHELFKNLLWIGFNETPTFDKLFHKGVLNTGVVRKKDREIVSTLFSLSPTFKTKPFRCSKEEFLNSPQPTISFLLKNRIKLQKLAFRIAMACDGSIGICIKKDGSFKPRLRLGCAHPFLLEEWKILTEKIGLKMNIEKDRNTWSGFHSLETSSIEEIKKFHEMGGFLPEEVIARRGKFKGIRKNTILELALNLKSINNFIGKKYVGDVRLRGSRPQTSSSLV